MASLEAEKESPLRLRVMQRQHYHSFGCNGCGYGLGEPCIPRLIDANLWRCKRIKRLSFELRTCNVDIDEREPLLLWTLEGTEICVS
jgi:hypothetical protein